MITEYAVIVVRTKIHVLNLCYTALKHFLQNRCISYQNKKNQESGDLKESSIDSLAS